MGCINRMRIIFLIIHGKLINFNIGVMFLLFSFRAVFSIRFLKAEVFWILWFIQFLLSLQIGHLIFQVVSLFDRSFILRSQFLYLFLLKYVGLVQIIVFFERLLVFQFRQIVLLLNIIDFKLKLFIFLYDGF